MFKDIKPGQEITVRFGRATLITGTVMDVSGSGGWVEFMGGVVIYESEGWYLDA